MTDPPYWALDTSVSVPLLLATHPLNDRMLAWAQGKTLRPCGHALAETYSVLTRLPGAMRITPAQAVALLDRNFADPLTLSGGAMATAHRTLATRGIWGGATWDGLVGLAALEHGATLVTRDARALATYDALGVHTLVLRDPDMGDLFGDLD